MMSSRNTGTVVVAILAIAALGVGAFSLINQVLPILPVAEVHKVVGIWEETERNTSYSPHNTTSNFLVAANEIEVLDTGYIAMSASNTTFTLQKSGWYNIKFTTLLTGVFVNSTYWVHLLVDGVIAGYFDRFSTQADTDYYHYVSGEIAVQSYGATAIQIYIFAGGLDTDIDISGDPNFEQIVIEYLVF
jgi:hypothetical protein